MPVEDKKTAYEAYEDYEFHAWQEHELKKEAAHAEDKPLPVCTLRTFQRIDTQSCFCTRLDQWVSFQCCRQCFSLRGKLLGVDREALVKGAVAVLNGERL